MTTLNSSLFSLFWAILLHINGISDAQECKAIARRVDKGFREFFLIDGEIKVPDSRKEVASHCRKGGRAVKGLKTYRDQCTSTLTAQILQLGINGISKSFQDLCAPENHARTLEINRCIPKQTIRKFSECFDRGEKLMLNIAKKTNSSTVLPFTCCGFNYMDECIVDSIGTACPDRFDLKVDEFFIKLYNSATAEMRDFACDRLKSISTCKSKYPEYSREIERLWNDGNRGRSSGRARSSGILNAMIRVSESLTQ